MRTQALKLPFALDRRTGEAKRQVKKRRTLVAFGAVVFVGLAVGLTLALRSQGGGPTGGPLTGHFATARYAQWGFSLRYPRTWTRVDWCWAGASITSPIGLLTNAEPAPTCPGPTVQGGSSFPPPEQLGSNVVSVFLANGGVLPGEKLRWNARVGGKPAHVARPYYRANVSPSMVTCPAGVRREYRIVNIAAALGVVGATICGPNLAAGNAAVDRILASIRFKR
jgi:hypothetical protein